MADFDADVPEEADETLDDGRAGLVQRPRQQDEAIDVGVRIELPAAVSADRDQRNPGGAALFSPDARQDPVDEARVRTQQLRGVGVGEELRLQRGAAGSQRVAPPADGRSRIDRRT